MSDPLLFAFQFGKTSGAKPRDPSEPMRILVLGNFGGHDAVSSGTATAGTVLAERKIRRIDIDNAPNVMSQISPKVAVPLADRSDSIVEIEIRAMDDFHPDSLYRKLPIFQGLRELRERLLDPDTFAQAATQLREAVPTAAAEEIASSSPETEPTVPTESDADTLERVLGRTASIAETATPSGDDSAISSLIKQIVSPHLVPGPDPRQKEYLQSLDAAVADQLRAILHHDSFQALEASWRGLDFLVSNAAAAEELKIYVWDVTKSDLLQAMESESGQLEDSYLFGRLVTEREENPWSIVIGDFSFGRQPHDLLLLSSLGAIAAQSGAPFLGAAAPGWLGCEAWTDEIAGTPKVQDALEEVRNWQALRSSPLAPWIGLAAPQFLLRLPYGAASDPLETFPFEEVEDPATQHAKFLWGSASLFCATLIATSFLENEWEMELGDVLEYGDMPAFTFSVDGETELKPCAEFYLSERVAQSILGSGVMPLLSFKNRNAVRLMRYQSIADPPASLNGPWN